MTDKYECPECGQNIEWDSSREDEYIQCPHCDCRLKSPTAASFKPKTLIGDYEIIKRLGLGGMGEVYLAEQKSMMRPVALKVLQKSLAEDQSYLERFYREVRMLAQIEHPNIVKAIETGYDETHRICYFSMRFIEGEDLKKRLDATGKIPEEDALHIIMHVALALQYVWDKYKLIHRDIKPANIILTEEREVKLMDLGISKTMDGQNSADLTMAGMMVGSPYYVSPEQAKAEKDLDFRADMYSLGASFFHILTGQVPFDNESTMAIIASHLTDPVPDPQKITPEISKKSVNIIYKMMAKQKADRYDTWDDALNDIEGAINKLASIDVRKTTSLQSAVILRSIQATGEISASTSSIASSQNISPIQKEPRTAPENTVSYYLNMLRSNLYLRFIGLVLILFLTFVFFFSVIKKGMREKREREASQKMKTALRYLTTMPQNKKAFHKAYNLLLKVKKTGNKKYIAQADIEIDQLKDNFFQYRQMAKKTFANKALQELETRSSALERNKEFKEALLLWKNYQRKGAYADELKKEIAEALVYLNNQIQKYTANDGGID